MDKYYPTISIVSDGMNYLQGNNIWFGQLPNVTAVSPTDLTWESTETFNAGLDLSLLNGKLTLTADAYVKTQMTYYFQSLCCLYWYQRSLSKMQGKYATKDSNYL